MVPGHLCHPALAFKALGKTVASQSLTILMAGFFSVETPEGARFLQASCTVSLQAGSQDCTVKKGSSFRNPKGLFAEKETCIMEVVETTAKRWKSHEYPCYVK